MLNYLNGIGAPRRKSGQRSSGGGSAAPARAARRAAGTFKGALRPIMKAAPKNPQQAARMAKRMMKTAAKTSPLNAMRIKKAIKQSRQRAIMQDAGEPLYVEPQYIPTELDDASLDETAAGIEEVNQDEFNDADTGGENMDDGDTDAIDAAAEIGLFYPGGAEFGASKKRQEKKAASAKGQKKAAKTDKKKASADAKRAKGQARLEKARSGGGRFKESFDKALDTAGKFLDKPKGKSGEDEEKQPSFFEKNKMLIIGGGAAALLGIFLLTRKK